MTIASMTGFARVSGATANFRWAWEVKSVNAKGLDLRLRLPSGFDAIEAEARASLGKKLTRGTCYATLSAQREAVTPEVYLNEGLLRRLAEAISHVGTNDTLRPASIDGLLGVRGVIEIRDAGDEESDLLAVQRAALEGLGETVTALAAMREQEGAALALILTQRLDRLTTLRQAAEDCPARKPEAVRAKLAESVALLAGQNKFDETRLYQEALLLAAKADVREELDRLETHIAAANELLQKGGPIGRRLDFLAQELGREANTLCAKSNDASLTAIGLELRVEIEQFREQVQNIE
ncbi:YicC family protein [Methylovirgula ligni]|nr:YicC/YloC family endoribonuclease [Methylovirgula ligni]QAY96506.1 YicC family protein [Methylovirgula ligni]